MLYKIVLYEESVLEHRIYDSHCISGTRMGCFGSTGLYIPFGPGLDRRGCSLHSTSRSWTGPCELPSSDHHRIIFRSSSNPTDHQFRKGEKEKQLGSSLRREWVDNLCEGFWCGQETLCVKESGARHRQFGGRRKGWDSVQFVIVRDSVEFVWYIVFCVRIVVIKE